MSTTTLSLPRGRFAVARPKLLDRLARGVLLARLAGLRSGSLEIIESDQVHRFGTPYGGSELTAKVYVKDPALFGRVLNGGTVGAGESYVRGEWVADDLTAVIRLLLQNLHVSDSLSGSVGRFLRPLARLRHVARRNSREGSRRNIHAHYDLGNDFFRLFLDDTLSYSSGIYTDADSTLEEAQIAKLDRLCQKLSLGPDDHLLEIGTGWGGLALHAATHYGCRVTTTTISRRQFEEARRRVEAAGLTDRITLLERDYRDLEGTYDKIVSVEMIEAVGADHYELFFNKCASLLRPEGQLLLQAITIADHRYERALRSVDFIQRWVFPGSCIPSVTALTLAAAKSSDLRAFHLEELGPHYARTLADWRGRFLDRTGEVLALGYPDELIRLWDFYLAYCEGGFAERHIGLAHLLMVRPGSRREPLVPSLGEAPRAVKAHA